MRIRTSQEAWSQYGGLGPDLDSEEVLNKRAALLRSKHFSVQLREVNREKVTVVSKCNKMESVNAKSKSNRERAIEFAKSIEKPRRRRTVSTVLIEDSSERGGGEEDKLQSLFRRHGELQREVGELKSRYT